MNFAEKVIIITGAGTGIGKGLARTLLKERAHVVLTGRRLEKLEEVVGSAENAHLATVLSVDVSKWKELRGLVDTVLAKYGRIDVVVNNAAVVYAGAVDAISAAEAEFLVKVNLIAPIWLNQLVMPILRKQREGMVVNVGSIGSLVQIPYQSFYCASKHGLHGFSHSLRRELADSHIKVVTVYPGNVTSELGTDAIKQRLREFKMGRWEAFMSEDAAGEIIAAGMRKEARSVFVTTPMQRHFVRMNWLFPALIERKFKQLGRKIEQTFTLATEWTRSRNTPPEPE